MYHVVLYQPEIPPNTGNIIRLCANTGSTLHLIHPLGFELGEKQVRRAGLDYHAMACVHEYRSLEAFQKQVAPKRLLACSTRAKMPYSACVFQPGDALVFGPETRGLPQAFLDQLPADQLLRIPMVARSRSLNLSNATAIILYEALRQADFPGAL